MWPLKNPLHQAPSGAKDPDAILMLHFKEGDETAFDAIFNKYFKYVYNVARKFFHSDGPAEEIAQEVFTQVYIVRESYEPTAQFKTWVHRITVNKCLNEIRKGEYRSRTESLDEVFKDEEGRPLERDLRDWKEKSPLENLENREFDQLFNRALAQLTESQRVCFILSRYGDLSYQEIARTVKTTESAVKSLIHRANSSLREAMKSYLKD